NLTLHTGLSDHALCRRDLEVHRAVDGKALWPPPAMLPVRPRLAASPGQRQVTAMPQDHIPNVLAERYASPAMRAIWSGEGKVRIERDYWIAVLKGQRDLGIPVPDGVIE